MLPAGTPTVLPTSTPTNTSIIPITNSSLDPGSNHPRGTSHAGTIIGGTLGGVGLIVLVLLSLYFWLKRRGVTYRCTGPIARSEPTEETESDRPLGATIAHGGQVKPYVLSRDHHRPGSHAILPSRVTGGDTSKPHIPAAEAASATLELLDPTPGSDYCSTGSLRAAAIVDTTATAPEFNGDTPCHRDNPPLALEMTFNNHSLLTALPSLNGADLSLTNTRSFQDVYSTSQSTAPPA